MKFKIFIIVVITLILINGCGPQSNEKILKIREKAISSGDPKYCENIQSSTYKEGCYIDVAEKIKDPTLCEKTKMRKDECYLDVSRAMDMTTTELCDKISSFINKDSCIRFAASEAKDISLCEKSSEREKDDCISFVATSNKDISLCGSITDTTKKNNCLSILNR